MPATSSEQPSPWRAIFENVRAAIGGRRDEHGVVGSINWLRKQMAANGANPNVVRNIIYRDKGRPSDKRVLFDLLNGLWEGAGKPPLQVPELEVLLSADGAAEQEIAQLLGRDKRRAYRLFVSGVRSGANPKLLVTGRPGSGKTVLIDYVQQALELPPPAVSRVIRLEFSNPDLGSSLARLADALGVSEALFEAKLVKVGLSGAFAVQADAQADVARLLVAGMRALCEAGGGVVLLLHLSQAVAGQDALGAAQLRLNTDEVPRVTAAEWLWTTLLAPMGALAGLSMLVTMAEAPLRVTGALGAFEGPLKLSPPSQSEAKRFVRSKLPHLSAALQDDIAKQAGRSFEDLRILTLLAEVREPNPGSALRASEEDLEAPLEALSSLVDAEDGNLSDFLSALAVLSLPEGPHFSAGALHALGQQDGPAQGALTRAFLDAVPTASGETQWRCFSRQLGRALRHRLSAKDPARYRRLQLAASRFYEPEALAKPSSEAAARYLQHLFEARDWQGLDGWMARHSARQSLIHGMWQAAQGELVDAELEAVAHHVARYYVRLASYDHPEARAAFALLERSKDSDTRAWTQLKRAEGAIYKGRYEEAEVLLAPWPEIRDPTLKADAELARANIARWRGELARAARHVALGARPLLGPEDRGESAAHALVRAKVAVWSGLIAKDQGKLDEALAHFEQVASNDGLVRARQAFQKGDVQARLGRFDAALRELATAVHLAEDCEAPVQERARYLARRARVLRKQGELLAAESDFGRSLALLGERAEAGGLAALELAFERAKIHDERALLSLARGQYDEAVLQFQENLRVFARYERECHVDASFRRLRSAVRLGLAYWARGVGQDYKLPFVRSGGGSGADLEQAQRLAEGVRARIASDPNRSQRYGPLYTQTLLVAALVGDDEGALACAQEAYGEARFAYQRALYGAFVAAAALRNRQAARALAQSLAAQRALRELTQGSEAQGVQAQGGQAQGVQGQGGQGERGDLGLLAWLKILELQSHLAGAAGPLAAADVLYAALEDAALTKHHEAVLRAFGEAAQNQPPSWAEHARLGALLGLREALPLEHLRLADALVARWRTLQSQPQAVAAD